MERAEVGGIDLQDSNIVVLIEADDLGLKARFVLKQDLNLVLTFLCRLNDMVVCHDVSVGGYDKSGTGNGACALLAEYVGTGCFQAKRPRSACSRARISRLPRAVSVLTLLPTVVPDMGLTELSFAVPSARFPITAFHEMKPPTSPPTNAHTRHMHASFSVPLRCASPHLSGAFSPRERSNWAPPSRLVLRDEFPRPHTGAAPGE